MMYSIFPVVIVLSAINLNRVASSLIATLSPWMNEGE